MNIVIRYKPDTEKVTEHFIATGYTLDDPQRIPPVDTTKLSVDSRRVLTMLGIPGSYQDHITLRDANGDSWQSRQLFDGDPDEDHHLFADSILQEWYDTVRRPLAEAALEKERWINHHGSAYLLARYTAGHDCQRQYVSERARKEHPSFTLDFDYAFNLRERTDPTHQAFDKAQAIPDSHVMWDADEDREVIVIDNFLGRYRLVADPKELPGEDKEVIHLTCPIDPEDWHRYYGYPADITYQQAHLIAINWCALAREYAQNRYPEFGVDIRPADSFRSSHGHAVLDYMHERLEARDGLRAELVDPNFDAEEYLENHPNP